MLIIGAGLSGLEAARLLHQNRIRAIVLEARNRTGGRIWSVKMKNGHVFDMGAGWIHGIQGNIPGGLMTNPLWDLTREAGIETRATLTNDLRVFSSLANLSFDAHHWHSKYVAYVRENTRETDTNESLQYYADKFVTANNFSDDDKQMFFSHLHMTIENQEGTELDTIHGRDVFAVTSSHYGDEHVFHKTGYASLIDHLVKDVEDIRLEHVVTTIRYGAEYAEVQTSRGQLFQAKFVLITVPLGVLKAKWIQFEPPLPSWKTQAIDRLGFGILDKAVLLWDTAWWNDTDYFFMRVSPRPAEFGFWVNANKWNDRPALVCFFAGKEAHRIETNLTKSQLIEEIRKVLQQMFPDRLVPEPTDSFVTSWKLDPFANGSYSFISVNQRRQDPSSLAEPINHQLLFAGEATNVDSYGFAHGALMSGRREVTRLLYVYDLISNRTLNSAGTSSADPSTSWFIVWWSLMLYSYRYDL